jgi:hypothetical protein
MSILRDGIRAQIGEELIKHKQEIARSASNIINDVIIRKQRFDEIRELMQSDTNSFSAQDIADLDSIQGELLIRIQEVYDLVSS